MLHGLIHARAPSLLIFVVRINLVKVSHRHIGQQSETIGIVMYGIVHARLALLLHSVVGTFRPEI